MRSVYKTMAILAILAIALVPLIATDDSDATVKRVGQCETSGFTDYDSGTLKITLNNDGGEAVKVIVKVYEFNNHSNTLAQKEAELTAGENTVVSLGWGYGSEGKKYVDVFVYDVNDETTPIAQENSVEIDVTHSIWKNSVTYIVIVIIVIVVIVAIILFIRSGKKTKSDTTMADRTFTKMHNEKVAKKSGAAEKKEYKSSGNKTRKSK